MQELPVPGFLDFDRIGSKTQIRGMSVKWGFGDFREFERLSENGLNSELTVGVLDSYDPRRFVPSLLGPESKLRSVDYDRRLGLASPGSADPQRGRGRVRGTTWPVYTGWGDLGSICPGGASLL